MGFNFVYWIHLSHHKVECDGYVGVSNNPNRRLKQHKNSRDNNHLKSFLKKYEDEFEMTILYTGYSEYCYKKEEELRPEGNIGLNKVKGGFNPPPGSHKGCLHKEETKIKMSKIKEKPVKCIETGDIFNSMIKASEHFGGNLKISDVVSGKRKRTHGLTFILIKEYLDAV